MTKHEGVKTNRDKKEAFDVQKRKALVPTEKVEVKTGPWNVGCARYSFGMPTMRKVAADANAIIRIGRRTVLNFSKIDEYLDSISM